MELQSSVLWEGAREPENRLHLLSSHHLPTSSSPAQGRGMLCAHDRGDDAFWEALGCAPHPQHLCHHLPPSCSRPDTVPCPVSALCVFAPASEHPIFQWPHFTTGTRLENLTELGHWASPLLSPSPVLRAAGIGTRTLLYCLQPFFLQSWTPTSRQGSSGWMLVS